MTTVECIKELCKKRKIPISRLEKDCGFSNGYISQLRKGVLPDNRLQIVAEYLNVNPILLSYGTILEFMNKEIDVDIEYPRYARKRQASYSYFVDSELPKYIEMMQRDESALELLKAYAKMTKEQADAFVKLAKETTKGSAD